MFADFYATELWKFLSVYVLNFMPMIHWNVYLLLNNFNTNDNLQFLCSIDWFYVLNTKINSCAIWLDFMAMIHWYIHVLFDFMPMIHWNVLDIWLVFMPMIHWNIHVIVDIVKQITAVSPLPYTHDHIPLNKQTNFHARYHQNTVSVLKWNIVICFITSRIT